MNVREAALDTLMKIEQGGAYSTIAVNDTLKQKKSCPKRCRSLYRTRIWDA